MKLAAIAIVLSSSVALGQSRTPTPPPPMPLRQQQSQTADPQNNQTANNTGATQQDVAYGNAGGTKLLLDVYMPSAKPAGPLPAVILIHGGGWTGGDKALMAGIGKFLARNNYVAFSIDYRLLSGNKNQWPAQLDDAQRAVRWVRANAKKYNIDPKRIGAFGHSAGAQMASLLGELDTRDNSDKALAAYSSKVQAVVDASGPIDFTRFNSEGKTFLAQLMGGAEEQIPDAWKQASPALMIDSGTAPFLIVHGTRDQNVSISQSEEFYAALLKAGVPATFVKVDDVHTFETEAAKRRLAFETLEFFNKYLKTGS